MDHAPNHGAAPPREETIHSDCPIFEHLADLWQRDGRTVPCRDDPEWERLTRPDRARHRRAPRPDHAAAPAMEQG
ncbi:hypothetical protein [Streptomyces sp. NPDC059247]|uniref:hypothetical protein n=1 Tax=Streptomyces sp. NPDC059247 TaxID=3346790 RepID=UPI0036A5F949